MGDEGAMPPAVWLLVREQFLAIMMSAHERCGKQSPALCVCRRPTLARHLWDVASSPRNFVAVVTVSRVAASGLESRCHTLRFGVSPMTLGVAVADEVTSKISRGGLTADGRHMYNRGGLNVIDSETGKEYRTNGPGGGCANVYQCATNDKWMIVNGGTFYRNYGSFVSVAKLGALGDLCPLERPAGVSSAIAWAGFNSSNPAEEAVVASVIERDDLHVDLLIQVLSLTLTFATEPTVSPSGFGVRPTVVTSTKVTVRKDFPSRFLDSVLCMKRQNGTTVFIVVFSFASGNEVLMVEEATGEATCLAKALTPSLSQQSQRIFLICYTSAPPSNTFCVEFWDCNDTAKPLRVVEQQAVFQLIAECGFFFKVSDMNASESSERKPCILVEEAASGKCVLSLKFASNEYLIIDRVFSFSP